MSRESRNATSLPGARESHAGDEFHFLWAARKTVQLLDPRSELCRLKIEGVAPPDEPGGGRGDMFLAADVTEYFGGGDFAHAKRTVVSQLKYSTRHPDREWTIGRLCQRGKSGRSLFSSLGAVYAGFRSQIPKGPLAGRLKIKLVSNQPLGAEVGELLRILHTEFIAQPQPSTEDIRTRLDRRKRTALDRLLSAATLPAEEVTEFLRCLGFSECGTPGLERQLTSLCAEAAVSFADPAYDATDKLMSLVRNAALPGKALHPGIGLSDLLAHFGIGSLERLFPCPPLLEQLPHSVATADASNLAKAVVAAGNVPVLVHGNAGTGKSMTLSALPKHLSPGSVVLIYDYFGRGITKTDYCSSSPD